MRHRFFGERRNLKNMTSELKPVRCGCGGEAKVGIVYPDGIRFYRVYCENCKTQTDIQDTKAEAITAWNRAMGADMNSIVSVFTSEVKDE